MAHLPLEACAWSSGDTIRALGLLLHGYGDCARNFLDCASYFHVPGILWVALQAPYGFGQGTPLAEGRMWFDLFDDPDRQIEASLERIWESVQALREATGCPPSRVVYLGFSQGGCMALRAGLQAAPHEAPAAIVSLSGFLLRSHRLPVSQDGPRQTPIFLGHGIRDQVVLPLWQYEVAEILRTRGYDRVAVHRYATEHSLHPDEMKDVQTFLRGVL